MKILKYKIVFLSILLLINSHLFISGQSEEILLKDSTQVQQKDIVDVFQRFFKRQLRNDTSVSKGAGPYVSVIPSIGYSLETGLIANIVTNTTFYPDDEKKRMSLIMIDGNYSQFHQVWFTAVSNIFLEKHNLLLFGDTRYYKYTTETYGLGANSSSSHPLKIGYSYLRFYQIISREMTPNLFLGIGVNLNYHWNIKVDSVKGRELDQFVMYQISNHSISTGISLNISYDNRKNEINPHNGIFANLQFRPNITFQGSDQNWQSLLVEFRHYIKIPASSDNILALWSYNNISISGTPPYLDMPSIGWDDYSSTGRGYITGRFTGRNLIYFESEFRFSLTKNGLLGAVIFGNAESIPEKISDVTYPIIPAAGFGLRIKVNKYSNTNLCIDYGFGLNGSRGFFFHMGEVF